MDAAARRAAILSRLEQTDHPVSAAALAREFAVSRQIIVGDVALLRAGGADIAATPGAMCSPGTAPPCCAPWPASTTGREWPGSWRSWWTRAARWWTWWWSTPSTASWPDSSTSPPGMMCRIYPLTLEKSGQPPLRPHRRHPPAHPALPQRGGLPAGAGSPGRGGTAVEGINRAHFEKIG